MLSLLPALALFAQTPADPGQIGDAQKLVTLRTFAVEGTRCPAASIVRLAGLSTGKKINFVTLHGALQKVTQSGLIENIDFEYEDQPDHPGEVKLIMKCRDAQPLVPGKIQIENTDEEAVWKWLQTELDPLFTRDLPPNENALRLYESWITQYLGAASEHVVFKAITMREVKRRVSASMFTLLILATLSAQAPASQTFAELQAKREALPGLHQEFTSSRSILLASGKTQASQSKIVIDQAGTQWRDQSITGSGTSVRLFDGQNLLHWEEGGDEFERLKRRAKDAPPQPLVYQDLDADWTKGVEVERRPCDLPGSLHECVVLEAPLKPWIRDGTRMLKGAVRVLLDTENGLLIGLSSRQSVQTASSGYQATRTYSLRRFSVGQLPDAGLLKLPASLREVKELSSWNAARLKKELGGKPAPELSLTGLQRQPITLSSLKGKTVLLDFWTTWCPPCRADGPALDKLYAKYGGKELEIIGISVSEDRAVVEQFLKEHPHAYPIALTSENEMPRPFQIGVFPTYIVIDETGVLTAAVEGDQGFGALRRLLKKAGLDVD